jgi:hypothetical protein
MPGWCSRCRATARTALQAGSAGSGGRATGGFTLVLEAGPRPAPVPSAAIRVGQTVQGVLDRHDQTENDYTYFDQYVFHGRAGQQVTITLRSPAFDGFLRFGRLVEGAFVRDLEDADGAGGKDARITTTLPADGDYVVRANALATHAMGAYTLTVSNGPAGR